MYIDINARLNVELMEEITIPCKELMSKEQHHVLERIRAHLEAYQLELN